MADLMTASCEFGDLVKKYKNFFAPAIEVLIDGKDAVKALKLALENVSVNLSLDSASSCGFTIINAYDAKNSKFSGDVKSKFTLGTVIEVKLGYSSETSLIFKGYISEVSASFSDVPSLSVTALDVRRLMMEGKERNKTHKVENYSDAFSEVMKRYAKLSPNPEIDATKDKLEPKEVVQLYSDYQFVSRELTKKANREFFVFAGKAYFREKAKVKDPVLTLEWGKSLTSFTRNSLYQSIEIKVVGYDENEKTVIVGEASEKSSEKQKDPIGEPQPTIRTDPDATDSEKASKRAKKEAEERKKRAQSASGTCIGIPEIIPGRFIKLKGLDPDVDNNYYIKSVRHSFGADGFTTEFEIGGWK